MEVLAPFEMVHRGFTEANQALREANVELDSRVRQRTAELEAAAEALKEGVERERAGREALERSETHARRLFESTLIGVFEEDEDHVFEANDAFLHIIGYTREDLIDGQALPSQPHCAGVHGRRRRRHRAAKSLRRIGAL